MECFGARTWKPTQCNLWTERTERGLPDTVNSLVLSHITENCVRKCVALTTWGDMVCLCVCVRMYVCMYVCICMYICMYACIYVRIYVCMYVCMHVCMCVCMYVHVCIGYVYANKVLISSTNKTQRSTSLLQAYINWGMFSKVDKEIINILYYTLRFFFPRAQING